MNEIETNVTYLFKLGVFITRRWANKSSMHSLTSEQVTVLLKLVLMSGAQLSMTNHLIKVIRKFF